MSVPSRFKESNFRRFEPAFKALVENYPRPVFFDPKLLGLSCETFTCRLRDAYTGLLKYGYETPVDLQILRSVWPNVVVNHDGTRVRIGPPGDKMSAGIEYQAEVFTRQAGAGGEILLENPTEPEVRAFALLVNNVRLQCTIRIREPNAWRFKELLDDPAFPNIVTQPDGADLLLI